MDNPENPEDLINGKYEDGRALAEAITKNLFDARRAVSDLDPAKRPTAPVVPPYSQNPGREPVRAEQQTGTEPDPHYRAGGRNPDPDEKNPAERRPAEFFPNGSAHSPDADMKWLDEPQTLYLRKKLHVHDAPSFVGNLAQVLSSSCVKDAMKKVKLMADLIESADKALYPVFAIDSDGKVLAWNKEMEQLTGIPAHDMISRGDYAYAVPFYGKPRPMLIDYLILPHPRSDNSITSVPGTRDIVSGREETIRILGKLRLIQSRGTRIYDEDGSIVAAVQSMAVSDPLPAAIQSGREKPEPESIPSYGFLPKSPVPHSGVFPVPADFPDRVRTDIRLPADIPERVRTDIRTPADSSDRTRTEIRLSAEKIPDRASGGQVTDKRYDDLNETLRQLMAKEDDLLRNSEVLSQDSRPITAPPLSHASDDLFEHVVMDVREGIIAWDTALRCILWNTFMEQLTGLSATEVLGKRAFEMFPALRDAGASQLLEQARSGKTVESADISCNIPISGKQVWVRLIISSLRDSNGNVIGIIGIVQDTTARKVMEYALQTTIMQLMESEEKYRSVFNSKNDPLLLIDTTNRAILDLNNAISELYGYPRKEFFTLSPADLFTEPEKYYNLLDRKSPGICLCRQRKKDGTIFPADISFAYFEMKSHRVLILSIRDLSTAYQTADALRLANTKLNLLIGITRHDVINNLTVLMGYNDLLKNTVKDTKILEMLDKEESALHAVHRQIEFTREYYNLGVKSPIWQNICETSTRAYSQFITTIHFTCDTHDLEIYADPLLEKVFYNLFDNAIRHGERITQVRIYCVREGPDLLLIFGDDGQGILPENKERIFKRGFGKHTGLGLFLSREILAITRIEISETGEFEKGARFELRIPAGFYRFPDSGNSLKVSGSETMNLHA